MRTVLVVDDSAFMRNRLTKLLNENGYKVVEAADGLEAVAVYKETAPDAVLMDVTMPAMDGLTALKQIRAGDPAARVAMVTAVGQQNMIMEAMKSGAKDYVVKPFDAQRVLATVQKLLA